MGRYSQSRRRGGGGHRLQDVPVPSVENDIDIFDGQETEVAQIEAVVYRPPPYGADRMGVQFRGSGSAEPWILTTWQGTGLHLINVGSAGEPTEAQAAWFQGAHQVSPWTVYVWQVVSGG